MLAALLAACVADTTDINAEWTVDPAPPAVGRDTVTRIMLRDAANAPVAGAKLRLEGHMSHPGMTPVVTAVTERGAGEYEARFQFSMAGDWTLVLTGDLPGGGRLTRQLDVVSVRPPE